MSPQPSPLVNRPTHLPEGPLKLELPLKNARGVSFDPDPDWTLDDLKTELEAIEEKYSFPLLPENKPCSRSGSIFSCQDLSAVADFGRSRKPFVMRAFDDDFDSSDEDADLDVDISRGIYDYSQPEINSRSDSEAENDQLDPEVAENQLMPRTGVVEGSLLELERERILRVQEEIRERIISSQADLEAETERSATALQLVEKDRESKREMARRVDKQYQRKIAEACDNHLSAVQRDHQQRSQIEERRIRKEAAVEEARKREARENKERQEKARAEAEAKLKAEMKAAAEARKAAAEAEKKAAAEAEKKAAKEAEKKAALEAEKRAASEAERKAKGEEKRSQESQQKSPRTLSTGINVKVAETAAKLEAERIAKFKALEEECQTLRSNPNLSKELRNCERQIGVRLRQITGTQEQVRAKSTELFQMITNPRVPQCILLTGFAVKAVSQCETQTLSLNSIAFALARVIVLVTSQVPIGMDLVLAEFHKACIFTVPKYIPYSKIAFESENLYYKTVGYREDNGKIESTDNYLARMKAYVTLYAAIIQTDIPGVNNLHGVKDGWAWMARFLNALPPNRFTASALEIFLKIAGFRLFQAYPKPFTKLLNAISREFIDKLKSQNDPDSNPVISNLETYLTSQQFRKEPEGRALAITDESKNLRA